MPVLVLQDVVVAVQMAGDVWQIGNDGCQLAKVEAVDTDRQVLKHGGVLVLGV